MTDIPMRWRRQYKSADRARSRHTVERLMAAGLLVVDPLVLVLAVSDCAAMLRRQRTIHRIQINRNRVAQCDLGGES